MTAEGEATVCAKSECEVAGSGTCAEGHDPPESCPFFGSDSDGGPPITDLEPVVEPETGPSALASVDLSSGEALSVEDVDEFLRWRPAMFVTIVGESDCGKSTLICSIYEQLRKGPFAGHQFAGSRTLIGFERRAHPSRLASGGTKPDTPRTSFQEGLHFFHLATASGDTRCDLMLSDRAGEMYRLARDDSDWIAHLQEVVKADRLVLLLDGGRVAVAEERAGAMQSVRQTLRALLDGGAAGETSVVQVVTTKIDRLDVHEDKGSLDAQLESFRSRLVEDFEARVADLSFWDTAARDPDGRLPPAHGVDRLFTEWITPRPAAETPARTDLRLTTEFDLLLSRTLIERS